MNGSMNKAADISGQAFSVTWIYFLFMLMPVAMYFGMIFLFGNNLPYADDFNDILYTVMRFYDSETITEKFSVLFRQHNEHRNLVPRVFYVLQLKLFGQVNFRGLLFWGNLPILGMGLLIMYCLKEGVHRGLLGLFVFFLLFQLQATQSMFWVMASVSNYYVLFFSLLAFIFLASQRMLGFPLAIFFAITAAFSQANGLFTFVAGGIYLLLNIPKHERPVYHLLIWVLVAALVGLLYFYDFSATRATTSVFERFINNPLLSFRHFVLIVGAGYANSKPWLALIEGVILLAALGFLLRQRYHEKQPALCMFVVYLLCSVVVISITRTVWGENQALVANRYRILSVLLWVVTVAMLVDWYVSRNNKFNTKALALALCFIVMSFFSSYVINAQRIEELNDFVKGNFVHWLEFGDKLGPNYSPGPAHLANLILKQVADRGYYDPAIIVPSARRPKAVKSSTCQFEPFAQYAENNGGVRFDLRESFHKGALTLGFKGWGAVKKRGLSINDSISLSLCSADGGGYLIELPNKLTIDIPNEVFTRKYKFGGIDVLIPRRRIAASEYRVGLLIVHKGKKYFTQTDIVINLGEL